MNIHVIKMTGHYERWDQEMGESTMNSIFLLQLSQR
jgi:hypothetical protein